MKVYFSRFLLLFVIIIGFVQGCKRMQPTDTCTENYYRVENLVFNTLVHKNGGIFGEVYGNDTYFTDTLPASDTLGIRLLFNSSFLVENSWKNLSFFPTANAFIITNQCPGGTKGRKGSIKKIYLSSNEDFDAQHLKNQSLNDLCFMMDEVSGNFDVPFEDFLQQVYAEGQEVSYLNSVYSKSLLILLKKKPLSGTKHTFSIWIENEKGEKSSFNSSEVFFK